MSLLNNTGNTWKNIENESPPNIEEPIERLTNSNDITIGVLVSSTIDSTAEKLQETIDNTIDSTAEKLQETIDNTIDSTAEKLQETIDNTIDSTAEKIKNAIYNRIKQFYKLLTSCRSGSYSKV